ncbi:MAG: hypothetical protein IID18_02505, partial [Nitrospinae bacterium]|nr:hypothetical protein [Nitrospinota bacterium]
GINAHPLLANAKKKFLAAEEFMPGSGAYNLARLMALLGNESGCREWLEKCTELDALPSNEILLGEADFTLVQNSKWFRLLAGPKDTGDNGKKP